MYSQRLFGGARLALAAAPSGEAEHPLQPPSAGPLVTLGRGAASFKTECALH
jgi:hypothetical protein